MSALVLQSDVGEGEIRTGRLHRRNVESAFLAALSPDLADHSAGEVPASQNECRCTRSAPLVTRTQICIWRSDQNSFQSASWLTAAAVAARACRIDPPPAPAATRRGATLSARFEATDDCCFAATVVFAAAIGRAAGKASPPII
jgi:hypothetical protein